MGAAEVERRRRIATRALPAFAGVALVGLVSGVVAGARTQSSAERVATEFVAAWRAGDHAAMYGLLTPAAQARTSLDAFRAAYAGAAETATATGVASAGEAREDGDAVVVPMAVRTEVFGTVEAELRLPAERRPASWLEERIAWEPHLSFPGVPPGESLRRKSESPPRADIVAADGTVLASDDDGARVSEDGERIAGRVGPTDERSGREDLYERGFSRKAPVGRSGLEEALEPLLAGTPGGELLGGDEVLASSDPRPAPAVRTTVDPELQADAVDALAGRSGGAAVLDAETAEVRALAGTAVSAPAPPGSTFKIVTATAALEGDVADPSSTFPVRTLEEVEEVELDAIQGEACGGTFATGFAESCNAMFAQVGLDLGADPLVSTAEDFGFNEEPAVPGAAESTIPAADALAPPGASAKRERLALAETAIGQGEVRATALQSASMAQTIAADGSRTQPTLVADAADSAAPVQVASAATAGTIGELMMAVVSEGTAAGSGLPAGSVAGKTGTALLDRDTQKALLSDEDTDAWFTAYAPADAPRLAVAVHLRGSGSGGKSAAPAAAPLVEAALASDEAAGGE